MESSEAPPVVPVGPAPKGRHRQTKIGVVTSNKMTKTVVVTVEMLKAHATYGRTMRRSSTFMAHDNIGCAIGDRVLIAETRPMSRRKRFRVVSVIQKTTRVEAERAS